jgi:polygalacturonase
MLRNFTVFKSNKRLLHLPPGAAFSALLFAFAVMPLAAQERPPLPVIPAKVFKITDYGAVGDGKTMNTDAIQKAVAACSAAGGGTVLVTAGEFLTRPFALASSMRLEVEKDAVIRIDNDFSTYPKGGKGYANSITASKAHDIEISGEGKIDGQGEPWWKAFRADKENFPHRPFMVVLTECTRVLVKDITLANSPSFHLVPGHCTDVTIDNVKITAPADAPNTDALDPSGWNYLITRCTFDVGDDNIAVKASAFGDGSKPSCENFTVTDCTFLHGHGLSIGGQTPGGMLGMKVSNCTFKDTGAGIRMKASREQGGLVENLSYDHITMTNVKNPIFITGYYPKMPQNPADDPAQPANTRGPIWRNITISNLTVTGSPNAGTIWGVPELPVSNVKLTNVKISAKEGMKIYNAKGVHFSSSQITVEKGDKLMLYNAQVDGL